MNKNRKTKRTKNNSSEDELEKKEYEHKKGKIQQNKNNHTSKRFNRIRTTTPAKGELHLIGIYIKHPFVLPSMQKSN